MRESSVALPTAIALTVVTPVFIGVVSAPGAAPAPEPAAATPTRALTVTHDISPTGSSTAYLLLLADGPAPASATLVSTSGEHVVDVTSDDQTDECDDLTARTTGLGTDRWCLRLSGLSAGQQVAGDLSGTSSKVSLTVATRSIVFPLPLLAALAGLILAVLLTLLVAPLGRIVAVAKLRKFVADNQSGNAANRISGLPGWVEARLAEGEDPAELTEQVQLLAARARADADEHRTTLAAAAGEAQAGEAPLLQRARAISADQNPLCECLWGVPGRR